MSTKGEVVRKPLWKTALLAGVVLLVLAGTWTWVRHRRSGSGTDEIRVFESTTAPTSWQLVQRLTGRDLLKERNIQIKIIPSVGAAPPHTALLAGQVDVGGGDWVGWINVIARGGKIKALWGGSAVTGGYKAGILVLDKSPIHSIRDFKGKTIAVNTLGLGAEYVIKRMLKRNGLSLSDVQLLVVPVTNEEQVLRSRQVDAVAWMTNGGIWFEAALERGGVRIIPGSSKFEVYGREATTTAGGFREDFIRQHPDLVRRYVAAIEESKRIIWDAYQKDPEGVKKIYAELTEKLGGNPLLAKYYRPTSPQTMIPTDWDLQFWIDDLVEEGKLKPGQVKPSDIYSDEYLPSQIQGKRGR